MKKIAVALFAVVVAHAAAAHAGMDVSIGVYTAPPVVLAPPPTVVYEAAPPPPPPLRVVPRFVYSPDLGFYVSEGAYDMAYIGRSYYRYDAGYWYVAPSYAGPWVPAGVRRLPPELRRHSYSDFSYYRDRACHHRMDDRRYGPRGRWDHPDYDRWNHRGGRW